MTPALAPRSLLACRIPAYRGALSGQVAAAEEDSPETGSLDDLPDDPTVLSYLVTAAMVLPTGERQDLLRRSRPASG